MASAVTERCLEKHKAWLTPILKFLSQALRPEAKLVVDANEEEDIVRIVETVMPGRCQFQKLEDYEADFVFARGKFSSDFRWGCRHDFRVKVERTSSRDIDITDDADYVYYLTKL
jgi:hypothetical protein